MFVIRVENFRASPKKLFNKEFGQKQTKSSINVNERGEKWEKICLIAEQIIKGAKERAVW